MILTKVTDFLKQNKKILYYLGFFAFIYFVMGDSVFAEKVNGVEVPDSDKLSWFNGFIQIITTGVGLMSSVVGVFLNPGWTNATGLGFQPIIKDLWIMVSNVVYFIFAILLIVIAFMNILGRGDKWELKQALPKFIIGVLIVPFSWFFVQLLLSISSILTASVLLLPYDVLVNNNKSVGDNVLNQPICNTFVIVTESKGKTGNGASEGTNPKSQSTQWCGASNFDGSDAKQTTVESLLTGNNVYGMLGIYTYGIFSASKVDELNGKDLKTFSSIFKLGLNVLVVLLMFVLYFILLISLGLALFVRGVWLWLYMIFSPVFGLLFFFGKEKDGFMEGKFSLTEFISLALVPVYVSGALAFGLLFIFTAGSSFGEGDISKGLISYNEINGTNKAVYEPLKDKDGKIVSSAKPVGLDSMTGSRITFGGTFNIDMYGEFGTSGKSSIETLGIFKSGIGTLLMQLFGLAILWIGVMAAMGASKITGAVVEPIAAFGKQIGGLIGKSPQYMPLFGGQSMKSLQAAGSQVQGTINSKSSEPGTKLADKIFGVDDLSKELTKIKNIAGKEQPRNDQRLQGYLKALSLASNETEYKRVIAHASNYNKDLGNIFKGASYSNKSTSANTIATNIKNSQFDINKGNQTLYGKDAIKAELEGKGPSVSGNSTSAGNNTKINSKGDNYVIEGDNITLGIKLKRESDGKFNVDNPNDVDNIAKAINKGNIGKDIVDEFNTELQNKIKKYFDNKGKFIKEGNSNNGILPYEIEDDIESDD